MVVVIFSVILFVMVAFIVIMSMTTNHAMLFSHMSMSKVKNRKIECL